MDQKKADLLMASISMLWGTSYILMKLGLNGISPFNLIVLRFGIAFIITFAVFFKKIRLADRNTVTCAAALGFILFGVFTSLMLGLKTTTASSAGFLTSTTVVFVPIIQSVISKRPPSFQTAAGVVFALAGIALLTLENGISVNAGSFLCLLGAFLYAFHIMLTDKFVKTADSLILGILQLGFTAFYALVFSFIFEFPSLPRDPSSWIIVMSLALLCSAYGFILQPVAQKYTTPERTGFIFTLEPVFSAVFAFFFLGETMKPRGYIGAFLIILSVFLPAVLHEPSKKQAC